MYTSLKAYIPKCLICFREGYSKIHFFDDLKAGLTVGVIALPLAMAFAIGSGVAPEQGLYTAIVAGFLISLLGGSRVQIGGPTGAFVVLVYATLQRHGYEGLCLATLISGIILIGMGILRLGLLIRYIPHSVITGFTTGIATVILTAQIKDFFGMQIPQPAVDFFSKIWQYCQYVETTNPATLVLSIVALVIILTLRRTSKKIPGAIIAIIATTALSALFSLPIETVESKFGAIPQSLPTPQIPLFSWEKLSQIAPDAIAIAILGAIESLLSCVVADGMTGYKHKSNCELVGQGIANIGSSLFCGIPATGAIARTTANIQMGAKTPVAGMIHALTLLVLMVLFAPLAGLMPLGALAAVLIVVAYNMSELDHFKAILKGPLSDKIVLVTTYLLTVIVDLTMAVQIGVLLALFFRYLLPQKTKEQTNV
jgi:SulP family sulfate permease